MNIKCPHCGAEYEVEKQDMYRQVKCSVCGKAFIAGATTSRSVVTSQTSGTNSSKVSNSDKSFDTARFAACLFLVLGDIGAGVGFIYFICSTVITFKNHLGYLLLFMLVAFVVLALVLLANWLAYSLQVAIFEIVKHLRQIRDQ